MPVIGTATLVLAASLSMDAFAAALGKGAGLRRPGLGAALAVGAVFGLFQAGMPLLGFMLGVTVGGLVQAVDHWIAFVLLTGIGARMAWAGWKGEEGAASGASGFALGALLMAGLATSVDALAAGVPLALLGGQVVATACVIGAVTFALSAAGVLMGRAVGPLLGRWAEGAGGIGLMLLGAKILAEHTL